MRPPLEVLVKWASRFPLRSEKSVDIAFMATDDDDTVSARAHASWLVDPAAAIEQRVLILERNLPLVQDRITALQSEYDSSIRSINDQLKTEVQQRHVLATNLEDQLKKYGTGGLHISAMGAVWLFLGAIFGCASVEISAMLQ